MSIYFVTARGKQTDFLDLGIDYYCKHALGVWFISLFPPALYMHLECLLLDECF